MKIKIHPSWHKAKRNDKSKKFCSCDSCGAAISVGDDCVFEDCNQLVHCSEECWENTCIELDQEIEERNLALYRGYGN